MIITSEPFPLSESSCGGVLWLALVRGDESPYVADLLYDFFCGSGSLISCFMRNMDTFWLSTLLDFWCRLALLLTFVQVLKLIGNLDASFLQEVKSGSQLGLTVDLCPCVACASLNLRIVAYFLKMKDNRSTL